MTTLVFPLLPLSPCPRCCPRTSVLALHLCNPFCTAVKRMSRAHNLCEPNAARVQCLVQLLAKGHYSESSDSREVSGRMQSKDWCQAD